MTDDLPVLYEWRRPDGNVLQTLVALAGMRPSIWPFDPMCPPRGPVQVWQTREGGQAELVADTPDGPAALVLYGSDSPAPFHPPVAADHGADPPPVTAATEPVFLRDWVDTEMTMTNFDHTVEDGMPEALVGRRAYGTHAGWEFNGKVWWADGQFHEAVYRYGDFQRVYSAGSLRDLMVVVNADWGWE